MAELLSVRGACLAFRRGRRQGRLRVLVNASLEVGVGEIVAVVGSRGEGKTTLLEVAAGILPPDEGQVWLGDVQLTVLGEEGRAELLGRDIRWVRPQGPGVAFDVLAHVGLPLAVGRGRRDAEQQALAALERVGAADCAGLRWEDLSNWKRVQVSFARGIVGSPRLLVLDDAMDGLGMRRTDEAGELLCSLAAELGCGVLMSASDVESTVIADRVLHFERGALEVLSDHSGLEAQVIDFPGAAGLGGVSRGARF